MGWQTAMGRGRRPSSSATMRPSKIARLASGKAISSLSFPEIVYNTRSPGWSLDTLQRHCLRHLISFVSVETRKQRQGFQECCCFSCCSFLFLLFDVG